CRNGRVTFLDVGAMLGEIKQNLRANAETLRRQWEVRGRTRPSGAFLLEYTIEREKGIIDAVATPGRPDNDASFRYSLSSWVAVRPGNDGGEPAEAALAPGSAFRRIIDPLDPQITAVTFWVYPDSFAVYRALRDHLHTRDIVVAGRPLPDGM